MAELFNHAAAPTRPLAPTPRERRLGQHGGPSSLPGGRPRKPGGGIKAGFGRFVRDMNPVSLNGPKLPLFVLGMSSLLATWDDQALALLLPEIKATFAISLQFMLTIGSVIGVFGILLGPLLGFLADRVKRVWLLRIGALLSNISSIGRALARNVPQLAAAQGVGSAGGVVTGPAGFPLLSDYYPSASRARVFAFLGVMGGLGGLVGAPIAGNLAERFGWRTAVLALGILATVVSLLYFLLREPVRGYWDRIEMGASEQVAQTEQRPVSWSEGWRAAGAIRTLRRFWYLTPFLSVMGTVSVFINLYFAQEFGLGPAARSYIVTINALVGLLGLAVAGPIGDRLLVYRPGRVLTLMGLLMLGFVASVVVLVFSRSLLLSILMGLPLSFAGAAIGPASSTVISLVVPARVRGLGMQTIAPWALVGLVLSPIIGGMVDQHGLRFGLAMFVPAGLIAAAILMTSSMGVDEDIRAAKAASLAEEELHLSRRAGRAKMLVCRDLDVSYNEVQVLFNVDFDLEEGEMVALLGPNGAGKSTLLRAIAGVEHAANGAILFNGEDVTHLPTHECAARGIVFVPGGSGVFPTLSVKDNLNMASLLYADDKQFVRDQLEVVLKLFPVLKQRSRTRAGNLSGGEQRMLSIAQTLMMKPKLLLIDELSFGLAPAVVEELLAALSRVQATGASIVLVEQSVNLALRAAQRAVFMEKGEIRYDGAAADLINHPELIRSVFLSGASGAATSLAQAVPGAGRERLHEELLQVGEAAVSFGGIEALGGVSLDLRAGEIMGVIGPNGAGKTTLFDVISGFVEPDRGYVALEGKDVTRLSPDARARRGLGRAFQSVRLFPAMTVRENILVAHEHQPSIKELALAAIWAPASRRAERKALNRAEFLMEVLGLTGFADKFLDELSTGTRRAVEIACMMAAEPRVVLLDEPSSGLAQAESIELGPVLARVVRETGCGMIVIEHNLPLVASIADRLVAMNLGRVTADGEPEYVLNHPDVLGSYLGSNETSRKETAGDG